MVNKYYQKNNKEKLQQEARERYQNCSEEEKGKRREKPETKKNLSEEEKEEKRQYHQDRNKILFEEEKQKKVKSMRNYY